MTRDLTKLSSSALSAAMRGGTVEWGNVEPQTARGANYLKCRCGCGRKAKFRAMFNGVCMYEGCEMAAHRFVRSAGGSAI